MSTLQDEAKKSMRTGYVDETKTIFRPSSNDLSRLIINTKTFTNLGNTLKKQETQPFTNSGNKKPSLNKLMVPKLLDICNYDLQEIFLNHELFARGYLKQESNKKPVVFNHLIN